MGPGMLANGRIIRQMEKEFCIIPMGMSMMENGSMIRQVGMEPIRILMVPLMLGSGFKISKMELGDRFGLMDKSTRDSIKTDARMGRDCLNSSIKVITKVSSL